MLARMEATTVQQTRISEIGAFLKPDESIMIFAVSFLYDGVVGVEYVRSGGSRGCFRERSSSSRGTIQENKMLVNRVDCIDASHL